MSAGSLRTGGETESPVAPSEQRQSRILLSATAIDTFGSGLNYALLSVFLVRAVGLSGTTVGFVVGIAAGVALPGSYVVGRLVDTIGPRRPLIGCYVLQGLAAALLPLASDAIAVCLVLSVLMFFTAGSRATRYAMMARIGSGGGVRLRGRSTVVSNVGVALGVGAAGLLIGFGHVSTLRWGLWANAATFLVAALIQRGLAGIPPVAERSSAQDEPGAAAKSSPFRDTAYLRVVLVNAVLMIQAQVFTLGYPLWVATTGRVPLWSTSVLFIVNTALVVLCQMWAVRRIGSNTDAADGWRRAGVLFLLGCGLMACVSTRDVIAVPLALAIMIAAAALHTFGEIWHGSGQFQLALGLADPARTGRYQGLFNMGEGVADCAAPLFVGYLCTGAGPWGWLGLGVALLLAGLTARPAVRSAERSRPYRSH